MARFNEPDDLYAGLEDALSPRDAAALYNTEVLGAELGIPSDVRDAMGDEVFGALPIESRQGRAEAIQFGQNDSLQYYSPGQGQGGEKYRNLAGIGRPGEAVYPDGPLGQYRTAAQLQEVPTSTSNPERPRTVAAGYDPDRAILTVVFRDGTYYNYYEVTPNEWQSFRSSLSKGQYILRVLDSHPRGEANVGQDDISADVRTAIYMVSRIAQVRRGGQMAPGINNKTLPMAPRPVKRTTKPGRNPAANAGKAPRPRKPRTK